MRWAETLRSPLFSESTSKTSVLLRVQAPRGPGVFNQESPSPGRWVLRMPLCTVSRGPCRDRPARAQAIAPFPGERRGLRVCAGSGAVLGLEPLVSGGRVSLPLSPSDQMWGGMAGFSCRLHRMGCPPVPWPSVCLDPHFGVSGVVALLVPVCEAACARRRPSSQPSRREALASRQLPCGISVLLAAPCRGPLPALLVRD